MITFFRSPSDIVFAVKSTNILDNETIDKLNWLFGDAEIILLSEINNAYIGPRAAMITPWSTNAVEITQNMGINSIQRIEQFFPFSIDSTWDPMLFQKYKTLGQDIFHLDINPAPILHIDNIEAYNQSEGLALSSEEVDYLTDLSTKLGRKLTDSEVFGFSQVNSEHCRHKIFNGTFIIDDVEKPHTLFSMIKKTSAVHPNGIISAYKDNVAFVEGPDAVQFAPVSEEKPSYYSKKNFESVLSLKAETHNFPTTVEPFNGAATGSGGEIRDRLAGGIGSLPLAGTAVYMTAYSRLIAGKPWEEAVEERQWLYQTPMDILIKASNGASDFGNKFGQPLISGSLLSFENQHKDTIIGYDKVIMLAGGVGYTVKSQAQKRNTQPGDLVVVLGGDNYRIGMGGAAVSSADTGEMGSGIELNAVQRSNPEMQKRAANVIRCLVESHHNPIVSIHDHGAGGHLNCLSELVEAQGGTINIDALPLGDPTLSAKEIIGNESQERMGLVIKSTDFPRIKEIAERERAPLYQVGEITGDHKFIIQSSTTGAKPMDLGMNDLFGSTPITILNDKSIHPNYPTIIGDTSNIERDLKWLLQLEAVACKDWLTNKVDRCVGGRVAKQQCVGPLQLPLNNCGVMALDYDTYRGVATSIGHAPISGLIDAEAGSRNSIGEALTNLIWAPLQKGLEGVSLSANWMWPCKNPGEDARLYQAVEACAQFAIDLGINIPTGKDSLSMKQRYPDKDVIAPGTVIISTVAHCTDIRKVVEPVIQSNAGSLFYVNMSFGKHELGGSSYAQLYNKIGTKSPDILDTHKFKTTFQILQQFINEGNTIVAGHDIGSGGLITTLLEMCFADNEAGLAIDLTSVGEENTAKLFFSENVGIVFQVALDKEKILQETFDNAKIPLYKIGQYTGNKTIDITNHKDKFVGNIQELRQEWYKTSWHLDKSQSGEKHADLRFNNYAKQPLQYTFPTYFTGRKPTFDANRKFKAAVIREKGSNSEREMAHALFLAGFDVLDVHMTDLMTGRETLENIDFVGAVGGFSNSDVLGSAKGWAGAFKYNTNAQKALFNFFNREDTLSVGICNGCQLFMELGLIYPEHDALPKMHHNDSHKHESNFTSVVIEPNSSVMLSSLAGSKLGVWISHGEGKFHLPKEESNYHIVAKYGYSDYPANPNGSDYNTAMLCSTNGRHLVMMPHIERSIFPWNWAHYPKDRKDDISPWIEAFVNARLWLEKRQ